PPDDHTRRNPGASADHGRYSLVGHLISTTRKPRTSSPDKFWATRRSARISGRVQTNRHLRSGIQICEYVPQLARREEILVVWTDEMGRTPSVEPIPCPTRRPPETSILHALGRWSRPTPWEFSLSRGVRPNCPSTKIKTFTSSPFPRVWRHSNF